MVNTIVDDRPQALLGNIGLLGCNFEDGALRVRVIAKSNDDGISVFALALFEDPKPIHREVRLLFRTGWPCRAVGSLDATRLPPLPLAVKEAVQIFVMLRFDGP
jgi:hypothetical protein